MDVTRTQLTKNWQLEHERLQNRNFNTIVETKADQQARIDRARKDYA